MATETLAVTWNASDVVTLKAGADLTGAYGKIVKLDSTEGQVVVATSMTESTDVGGYMGVVVKPPSGTATGLPVGIVSRAGRRPDHRSLVPFDALAPAVQDLDALYRDAIRAAARAVRIPQEVT